MSDWMLDELAHAGHEHLAAAYVARYEAKAGYDPAPDIEVLTRHGFGADSTVVDMGAGTGRFAVTAATRCRHVVAVDVSPAMVAVLRQRTSTLAQSNITVVQAGFLSYEHAGAPADFVFTRNALHQIPDFWKGIALTRLAAMLAPGGILRLRDLIYDIEPGEVATWIPPWFAGAVADPAKGYTADDLAEHVRTEHSTYRWLFEPLLEHAGFEIVDCSFVRGAYGAYTCRRR